MELRKPPDSNRQLSRLAASPVSSAAVHFRYKFCVYDQPRVRALANRTRRYRKAHSRHSNQFQWDDGRQLAADPSVVLPSDHCRHIPRLERQEAFRAPKTSRDWRSLDYVEDDSELYRMGLLYDDEHCGLSSSCSFSDSSSIQSHGPSFTLNSIIHREPTYIMRASRHGRRLQSSAAADPEFPYLTLDLSFTSFSHGVHYPSPPASESGDEEPSSDVQDDLSTHAAFDAQLHVIYELQEGSISRPMTPITQVPELIPDEEDIDEEEWLSLSEDGEWSFAGASEAIAEAMEDTASATGDAWIVLGDGS